MNEISRLKSLRLLDIGENQLSDLPSTIAELPLLEEIWISGNKFDGIPEIIKKIDSIKKIL